MLDLIRHLHGTPSVILKPRTALAELFAESGYKRGAEIGVWEGDFSRYLCEHIPNLYLMCVDAWTPYGGPETQACASDPVFAKRVVDAYAKAVAQLKPYDCDIRRGFSTKVAQTVGDGTLDFVYIDGAHDFFHVMTDLMAWAPKVRPGGVIAGHDYKHYRRSMQVRVVEAVNAYTAAYDIAPWFVLGSDDDPSFFWVKPV